MGPSSPEPAPQPDSHWPPEPRPALPQPQVRERLTRYVVLFVLTFITTTLAGAEYYAGFISELGRVDVELNAGLLLGGLLYSVPVLLILGAHEFGHYFACRYYGVNASLPFFIPFLPFGGAPGTFGAVIRIRQPIASKREFFDIGIAGPIAGFLALVPILVFAIGASSVVELPADFKGVEFGEPLLFRLVSLAVFGEIPARHTVNLHPAGWAAWFGMLATALNLAPIGQLDGGHISYAVFGRRSTAITIVMTMLMVAALFVSSGYALFTALIVVMVLALGPRHPRTADEDEPLDRARLILAVFAAVMFVLCFTPVPVQLVGTP